MKTKSITFDLLKNSNNVCNITIENDNVSINSNLTVKKDIATFASRAKAQVNGVNGVYLGCPIGTIVMWPGETVPTGWLFCKGQALNKNGEYSALYDVIEYKYGGSDSTFKLPDLQQRFPLGATSYPQKQKFDIENRIENGYNEVRGLDGSVTVSQKYATTKLGNTGGDSEVKLTETTIPSHNHEVDHSATYGGKDASNKVKYRSSGGGTGVNGTLDANSNYNDDCLLIEHTCSLFGRSKEHSNMPPYIALNFIIKFQ